jgi:hypothetical protein
MRSGVTAWVTASLVLAGLSGWVAPTASAQRNAAFQIGQAGPRKDIRPSDRRAPRERPGNPKQSGPTALNDMVLRLMEMPPARRREALRNSPRLRNMPERQRAQLLGRLDQIDRMSADERELLVQRYQLFSRLKPEQQRRARTLYRDWAGLPRDRRILMTRGIQRLRRMPVAERKAALDSDAFTERFSDSELQMLQDLSNLTDETP